MTTRILFVCAGNTCRSPMAAGIANALYSDSMVAESAGTTVHGSDPANPAAVAVTQDTYDLDLSEHRTRQIEDVDWSDFDLVVAMHSSVADYLKRDYQFPDGMLTIWHISDPHLRGRQAYQECLKEIQNELQPLVEALPSHESVRREIHKRHDPVDDDPNLTPLARRAQRLQADVGRWRVDLEHEEPRGTLLEGAWKKAVGGLEAALRDTLEVYFNICEWSFQEVKTRHAIDSNDIASMSLGSLIFTFDKLDVTLTKHLRRMDGTAAEHLRKRLLFHPVRATLQRINRHRRPFIHQRDQYEQYAKDEEELRRQLRPVLEDVDEVLQDELIQLAVILQEVQQ